MKFEIPVCIGVSVLLTVLVFGFSTGGTPVINRPDGWSLLCCFALFMWYSFYRDRKNSKLTATNGAEEVEQGSFGVAVLKVLGGLAVLIAKSFGVNDAFISLTLIACGTSLPELAASVAAALKKNTQLALGNVIGSNIFNITWILGLSSQVMPLNSSGITVMDYCVMTAAAIATLILGAKGKIGRASGAVLFAGFIAYTWYLLSTQIG